MIEIRPISAEHLPEEFGRKLDLIISACNHGYEFPAYLLDKLTSDKGWLMLEVRQPGNGEGVIILESRPDTLHVRLLAIKANGPWLAEVVEWLAGLASHLGLKGLTACGRKGWLRKLRPFGVVKQGDTYYRGC
jgi:hypothetical protein